MRSRTSKPKTYTYSPDSLDAMFSKILSRLDKQDYDTDQRHRQNTEKLNEIVDQTRLTNGRVSTLERSVEDLQRENNGKRKRIATIATVASMIASPLIYLAANYVPKLFSH